MAKRVIVDEATNQMTLVDVIEEMTISRRESTEEVVGLPLIAAKYELLTLWGRNDNDTPERSSMILRLSLPDGRVEEMSPMEIDLSKDIRARNLVRIGVLPFGGAGDYSFKIYQSETSAAAGQELLVGDVSFSVRLREDD